MICEYCQIHPHSPFCVMGWDESECIWVPLYSKSLREARLVQVKASVFERWRCGRVNQEPLSLIGPRSDDFLFLEIPGHNRYIPVWTSEAQGWEEISKWIYENCPSMHP